MKHLILALTIGLLAFGLSACPKDPGPNPQTGNFSLDTTDVTISQGDSGTVTVKIKRSGNFTSLVTLSINNPPTGVTTTFNPTNADGASVLTLNVAANTVVKSYPIIVTGKADNKTHTTTFSLTVSKKPVAGSFTLTATDASIQKNSINPTASNPEAQSIISINRKNEFNKAIALTTENLPKGVEATFTPNNTKDDKSTLKLELTGNPDAKTYTVTVKGTAGATTASTTFKLIIKAKPDTTKPTIVTATPADKSSGNKDDTKIVITFSEPMNKKSAQDAFMSLDIGVVTFSWDTSDKIMTVTPKNKLKYSANDKHKYYSYNIVVTAKDKAGNELVKGVKVKFSTYRTESKYIESNPDLDGSIDSDGTVAGIHADWITVGDFLSDVYSRGFLSFDISHLPKDTLAIFEAQIEAEQFRVVGDPYTKLSTSVKHLRIFHIDIGDKLDFTDFNAKPKNKESLEFSSTRSVGKKGLMVTKWLQEDFASGSKKAEFRLQFQINTNGKKDQDWVQFRSGDYKDDKPGLLISYWIP